MSSRPGVGAANHLLAILPPGDLALLRPHLHECVLPHGMVLHRPGEAITEVYFPHTAAIALFTVLEAGDSVETALVGREGVVGAAAGFGIAQAFCQAIVQVPGTGARIAVRPLRAAVLQSEALRDLLLRFQEALLAHVQQSAACNAVHSVESRMCRCLLQIHDRAEADLLPLTQEALAQMLGVQRTTVTLIASALQEAGVIRYRRGRIAILDFVRLREHACECYASTQHRYAQLLAGEPPASEPVAAAMPG